MNQDELPDPIRHILLDILAALALPAIGYAIVLSAAPQLNWVTWVGLIICLSTLPVLIYLARANWNGRKARAIGIVLLGSIIALVGPLTLFVSSAQQRTKAVAEFFPAVTAQVVLEATGAEVGSFHFRISNLSAADVRLTGMEFKAPDVVGEQPLLKEPKLVAAGSSIIVPGAPKSGLGNDPQLQVTIAYRGQLDGNDYDFHRIFQFFLPSDFPRDIGLDPIQQSEYKGPAVFSNSGDQIVRALLRPTGTIVLAMPEKTPEGSENYIDLKVDRRRVVYDPSQKRVTFLAIDEDGRIKSITIPTKRNPHDAHIMAFVWDTPQSWIGLSVDFSPLTKQ